MLGKVEVQVQLLAKLQELYAKPFEECSIEEKYAALVSVVADNAANIRSLTNDRNNGQKRKRVFYFSMEFLVGRLLENYLINLGARDAVRDALEELGIDFEELCACEADPGLGNGGLGRLAACFMDSMAALDVPGTGMGLRFRFGLFRQRIESGYQVEDPDSWMENGYPWEKAKPQEAVEVRFGGDIERTYENGKMGFIHKNYHPVLAVPYDVPVVGFDGISVNKLRLWQARPARECVDMDAFNHGDYASAMRDRAETEAITCILYPNDNQDSGKVLRIKQEYLMVAAGLEDIFRKYKEHFGSNHWKEMPEYISVHTNDTHPAFCVPEMMRKLVDEEGLEWDDAWDITCRTISFTNHTVLPEALEKWPQEMLSRLLPRIYMIIEEIDRRWKLGLQSRNDLGQDAFALTEIFHNGQVRMANLSIIGSHSVNGVAGLHTDILKNSLFNTFYRLDPEKFNNKTNGISHRRFMIQSNPGLAKLITSAIGDQWKRDFAQISGIEKYSDDAAFLEGLAAVKRENKLRLAKYVEEKSRIIIDPESMFDIQVKRIHAYKRQILNAFKVLDLYNRLKSDPNADIKPVTFIFAGKSAPGYAFAKESIKFICSVADIVNSDPAVRDRLKVVFIENFCVSNAQIIYPAADISEQISTAGKEASGTGNMKFMMNGAVTLGTMDGANVEIHDLVGDENIKIFGLRADETDNFYRHGGYNPQYEIQSNPAIRRITDQLIDGFFDRCGQKFWGIYDALTSQNDEYFVLKDFQSYTNAWGELENLYYNDQKKWAKMSLVNIARSSYFSSDRTIREYCEDIWHAPCK